MNNLRIKIEIIFTRLFLLFIPDLAVSVKNNFNLILINFFGQCVMNYVTMPVISDLSIFVHLSYHILC